MGKKSKGDNTTTRYHSAPTRMARIKKIISCEVVGQLKSLHSADGSTKWCNFGRIWQFLTQLNSVVI